MTRPTRYKVEDALLRRSQAKGNPGKGIAGKTADILAAEVIALRAELALLDSKPTYSTLLADKLFAALDEARYSGSTNLDVMRDEGLDDVVDALKALRASREPAL